MEISAPISAQHYALGRAMRELRARRAFSQEQLGVETGLHRNCVGAIERGEINPTFKTLLQLCAGLGVSLSVLTALYEERRDEFVKDLRRRERRARRGRRAAR